MKYYDVEIAASFTKTIHVKAPNARLAETLAETIFKHTDVLSLDLADLDDFEAYATPADDTDEDDDCCYVGGPDEDEELPFDSYSPQAHCDKDSLQKVVDDLLEIIADHEIHIHIVP